MCTTNDKPFLTYEQQIEKLKSKGLTIDKASINLIQIWLTFIPCIFLTIH